MGTIADKKSLKVLMVSSVWPTDAKPYLVPFLVEQVHSLQKQGVDIEVFSFCGKGNPVRYAWYWAKLHYKCWYTRYDIIHAQFGQSAIISLPTPLPLVITFHGSDLHGWVGSNGAYSFAGRIMQKMSWIAARQADQVIVVSEHLTRFLPTNLSLNLIPCGIDLELFHPIPQVEARKQLNLPLDKTLVLFAADPANPIKRFSLAQQAFDLFKSGQNAQLIVATGIPHTMMPVYMNACDVLVLTSRHEGSPTIVKEALACNLPIVSADVGDVRQRVTAIEGCLVCEDDSARSFAEGLLSVVKHGRLKEGFRVVKDFELANISAEILKVYTAAISR